MQILGFQPNSITWFENYLTDRSQQLSMDGIYSENLHVGAKSIIQGSVMSCALYLIYILDLPVLFSGQQEVDNPLTIQPNPNNTNPTNQTFVDDIMTTVVKKDNTPLQETVDKTLETLENYMVSNWLAVNRDKTQLMVIQKPNQTKSIIIIVAQPYNVLPKPTIKFLGVTLSDKLDFKPFLLDGKQNLYNQLKKRISAVKKVRHLIGFQFAKNLATGTFMSKLSYAAEMWGGAPSYIIKKFQSLQLEM